MKVYRESMIDNIRKMQREYYEKNGKQPNVLELSLFEYNQLQDEVNAFLVQKSNDTHVFNGMRIVIKD